VPRPVRIRAVTPLEEFTVRLIGKYLSSLRKLDHIIAPKEGVEAQL
jgi:hypothetical protein